MSFLYPDLQTGLQGRFVAATMLAAGLICRTCYAPKFMGIDCTTTLSGEAMVDSKQSLNDGMVKISVTTRGRGGDLFASDPSTETHLTSSPMLRDPYEAKVRVI